MGNAIEKTKSPKGELLWVTITGEGKENLNGTMQYKAELVLDPNTNDDHAAYLAKIDEFWEANKPAGFKKKAKSLGWYLNDPILDKDGEHVLDEDGEKTYVAIKDGGKVRLSFKTATTFPDGKEKVVKTYNSKARRIELGDVSIGNGSIGYVGGAMGIYTVKDKSGKKVIDAGVTLYLDGIMLTKLVKYEGGDVGFDAEADDNMDEDEGFTGIGEDDDFESVEDGEGKQPRL
jgi:hypothetical protein